MNIKKKIKLTFIITGLVPDGAERMLLKLIESIDRGRFSPRVISLTTNKIEIKHQLELLHVQVHRLDFRNLIKLPVEFIKLLIILMKEKPDIVHTWMYHADLIGGLAARMVGVRFLIWGIRHDNLSINHNKKFIIIIAKFCSIISSFLPSAILSCSARAKENHENFGYCSKKMYVIPNGFNLDLFQPSSNARKEIFSELRCGHENRLVGLVGRYDILKNHVGFIQAASMIAKGVPNVKFLLVGAGIDEANERLKLLIQDMGVKEHFYLLGERKDIHRVIASLDVLVSSSLGEGFPNVLGEAMACEVPCVVTNVGDSAEIVGDTGFVVNSGDMKALANGVIQLLSDEGLRSKLGNQARVRVREMYEISNVTTRYENFYVDICRE